MRATGKLKAISAARARQPGTYGDGGGLYLQVSAAGAKSWIFRYWVSQREAATGAPIRNPSTGKVRGRSREMGLGSCATVSLSEARERALECRRQLDKGIDPIEARKQLRQLDALEQAKTTTFRDAAASFINAHQSSWKNAKHAAQWSSTLEGYAYPIIGNLSVQAIDTLLVMRILEPVWSAKPETASRVRGRIEAVLDWSTVRGFRTGDNPARWRGHLAHLLPAISKVRAVKHHAAMPFEELPAFLVELRAQQGVAARALEFTILTAARTGEAIGARRKEVNLQEKIWAIPADRMKAGKQHRVPLSWRALELLETTTNLGEEFLFPGGNPDHPLSNMAMLKVLERMGRGDLTVHGFRSTFRDWASERTDTQNEVIEMALAHAVSDKVEAAYRRGDLFEKRRRLMEAWSAACSSVVAPPATVLPLRGMGR